MFVLDRTRRKRGMRLGKPPLASPWRHAHLYSLSITLWHVAGACRWLLRLPRQRAWRVRRVHCPVWLRRTSFRTGRPRNLLVGKFIKQSASAESAQCGLTLPSRGRHKGYALALPLMSNVRHHKKSSAARRRTWTHRMHPLRLLLADCTFPSQRVEANAGSFKR